LWRRHADLVGLLARRTAADAHNTSNMLQHKPSLFFSLATKIVWENVHSEIEYTQQKTQHPLDDVLRFINNKVKATEMTLKLLNSLSCILGCNVTQQKLKYFPVVDLFS
jgi:hypothetical protein